MPPEKNIHRVILKDKNRNNLKSKIINLYHKLFIPELYRGRTELFTSFLNESTRLIHLFNFDCIYCSSGPETTIFIGYEISKAFNIPWIVDFRDIPEMYKFTHITDIIYKQNLIRRQNKLLQRAVLIITVSEPFADKLKKRVKKEINLVLNGFDSHLHKSIAYPSHFEKFNIVYTGQLYSRKDRNPQYLFQSIDELIIAKKIDPNKLYIEFYGTEKKEIEDLSANYLCKKLIKIHDHCSLFDSLVYQHNACILLFLSVINQKGIYSTKIFDYLASRRPILSIPDDADVINHILFENKSGFCASTIDEIKNIIFNWYNEWSKNYYIKLNRDEEKIEIFSRECQSNKLVNLINEKIDYSIHS